LISKPKIRRMVRDALAEDIGGGDATSKALLPAHLRGRAFIVAKNPGTIAGTVLAAETFSNVNPKLRVRVLKRDGAKVKRGTRILSVQGPIASILTAERTALNFLQRLSGVATLASKFVGAVRGTRCKILDTRKTTPGWRALEKHAVKCGGAINHRLGLDDMILIKDNHLCALRGQPRAIAAAVRAARKKFPRLRIEVEADRLSQLRQAIEAGADIVLLDNMSIATMRKAVQWTRKRAKLEASGGISLQNVRRVAKTGVDFISVGALTHSAPALDLSLEVR